MKNFLICTFIAGVTLLPACTKSKLNDGLPENAVLTSAQGPAADRATALADYQTNYLGSALNNVGWTGNTDDCDAGNSSPDARNKLLQRLKYFRRLAGLPDSIVLNDSLNRKCQEAALMMESNNQLCHYPTPDWHCFTSEGQEAAAFSNLALGTSGPDVIDLYIADEGVTSLGHRRWILFPPLVEVGTGDTQHSNALWVIGNFGPPVTMPFVAYPGNGYIPAPLVFPTWSFAVSGADFSGASVRMTDSSGNTIPVSSHITAQGYGDNAIAWSPENLAPGTLTADMLINVSVSGVMVQGVSKDYQYQVHIFIPAPAELQ